MKLMNYNQLKVHVKNVTVLVEDFVQEMVKLLDAEAKDKARSGGGVRLGFEGGQTHYSVVFQKTWFPKYIVKNMQL